MALRACYREVFLIFCGENPAGHTISASKTILYREKPHRSWGLKSLARFFEARHDRSCFAQ